MRWRLSLEEYKPTFFYLQGSKNVVADALSRVPTKSPVSLASRLNALPTNAPVRLQPPGPTPAEADDAL